MIGHVSLFPLNWLFCRLSVQRGIVPRDSCDWLLVCVLAFGGGAEG